MGPHGVDTANCSIGPIRSRPQFDPNGEHRQTCHEPWHVRSTLC